VRPEEEDEMFGSEKPEVLIVGAGPVGLVTALTLAQRGCKIQIIDEAWRPTAHAYALALHPRSLALLDDLGVLGSVLEEAYRVRTIGLYDGPARRDQIQLATLEDDFSFVAVLKQSRLETVLTDELAKHGVKVKWHHRMTRLQPAGDHADTTVARLERYSTGYAAAYASMMISSTNDYRVPFVIGCDGCHSLVRRCVEIDFPEVAPAQHFAVFEFTTDFDFAHEMRIVASQAHQSVAWPLSSGRCRFSFELPHYDDPTDERTKSRSMVELGAARYPMLEEENLSELLRDRTPWFTGSVEQIDWRLVVRFERRLAESFGSGSVWLAGDAGHMASPIGIQSMNVGLREGYELAGVVGDVLKQGAGPQALAAYADGRQAEWKQLLGLEGELTPTGDSTSWLAPYGSQVATWLPASGEDLRALLGQLGWTWRT
jgi:2-polyprenyl-6-methoxyphenol hydroxylase-like FAD-dependent oxidoreductase